jgi:arabinofuranosyltransferase
MNPIPTAVSCACYTCRHDLFVSALVISNIRIVEASLEQVNTRFLCGDGMHRQNMQRVISSILPITLVFLAVAIFLFRAWRMDDGRYVLFDDAFISFRYARNLAQGEGLVFNPGERVEGYSNFLWTVMLAGAVRSGIDAMDAAKGLGILCGALILWLTWKLTGAMIPGRRFFQAIPVFILALTAGLPRFALSGMEVLMFSLWLCLALWFELGMREPWGGLFMALSLALAALTRPEGLLFFAVIVAARNIERLRRGEGLMFVLKGTLIRLLVFCAVFLPYSVWRFSYYGYPLPNTFYAKVGGLTIAAISRGLLYVRNELLLVYLPLSLWGLCALFAIKRRGVSAILSALFAFFLYLIAIGGDDWAVFGPRFLFVVFPWMAVLGAVGVAGWNPRRRFLQAAFSAAVLLLVGCLSLFEAAAYRNVVETMNRGWWTAAEWLSRTAAEDDLIAVDAAGIIPYHTALSTLDMFGLNDLHIAHLTVSQMGSGLAGHEKCDPAYVLEHQPDYIASWLDSRGQPITAGLFQIAGPLMDEYALAAVFLMRVPISDEPTWLDISETGFSEGQYRYGYIYGLFRKRQTAAR